MVGACVTGSPSIAAVFGNQMPSIVIVFDWTIIMWNSPVFRDFGLFHFFIAMVSAVVSDGTWCGGLRRKT